MTVAAHQVLKRVPRELRLILRILRADRLQRERRLGEPLRLRREWEATGRAGPGHHLVPSKTQHRVVPVAARLYRLRHQAQAMRW